MSGESLFRVFLSVWKLTEEIFISISQKCIGQQRCAVTISMNNFGGDPCPNVMKRVAVEAICTSTEQPN